jgi:putative transposase
VKYAFMQAHEHAFGVKRMCQVLGVSRSGYYEWRGRSERRAARDEVLLGHIRRVHARSHQAYGAKKTWIELNAEGVRCGKHRVARLRKSAGIEPRRTRRFRTKRAHQKSAPAAPNLLAQRFETRLRNRVWVGDTTFVPTRRGFAYLAVLLDLHARRVVGWALGADTTRSSCSQRCIWRSSSALRLRAWCITATRARFMEHGSIARRSIGMAYGPA